MDPLDLFFTDQARAFDAKDPMASLCTVANVDDKQQPQVRTLVLRKLDNRLGIFVNASSPKWPHIQDNVAFTTYWPSVQIQYRLEAATEVIEDAIVAASWLLRPTAPQRMDWLYATHAAQGSAIESRQQLIDIASNVQLPDPLKAPQQAMGLYLNPTQVERLDLTQDNGIHDRTRYRWQNGAWLKETLIP